ncbi:UNVERIFIED_CONTAM: hypothetical protein NCL1_40776 [Trichonephila clavipes]
MVFHKCFQLLMEMVSPPVVGLILICLIGGLSEALSTHQPHPIHSKLFHSSPPSPHPCTASWFICNKAKLFIPRRKDSYNASLSTPEIKKGLTVNNRTGIKVIRKGLAHVLDRTKSAKHFGKIAKKGMKEESKVPLDKPQLDILRNPKEKQKSSSIINGRFDPQTVSSLEQLLNSLLRNRNYYITLSVDEAKRDNYFVKLFENLPNVRSSNKKRSPVSTTEIPSKSSIESVSHIQKPSTTLSDKSLMNSIRVGDLTRRPKVKPSHPTIASNQTVKEIIRTRKPKTGKNSFVTENPLTDISNDIISPTTPFTVENQTHKPRRSGRKLTLLEDSKQEKKEESIHRGVIGSLFSNKTILSRLTDKAKTVNDLFNYTYQISAMERGSLFPHDPFPDTDKEFGKRSSFISPFDIQDHEIPVDTASTANNTSVYNSLRPRLRTTKSPHAKITFGQRPFSVPSSTSPFRKNSTTPRTRFKIKMLLSENQDINTSLPISDTNSTVTSDLNDTRNDLLKLDSLVLFPKRIDSNYARSFDREPRNNNAKVPKLPSNQKNSVSANFSTSMPRRVAVRERNSTERYRYSIGIRRQLNSNRSNPLLPKLNKTMARNVDIRESTLQDFFEVTTMPNIISETLLRRISENLKRRNSSIGTGRSSSNETEMTTESPEADVARKPKMTDSDNSENIAIKKPKLDPKTFYDYLMKASMGDAAYNFTIPEFRPGNFFRYDGIYPRKPVMDMAYSRPPPLFKVRLSTTEPTTEETPTTFESMRTSIRVSSTFYPNRMQDITMRFGNVPESPTTLPSPTLKEGEADESEFRDTALPGFTMEKLAYLLIGTCCGLSILCLCVVVIAIKCRRALVEKRIKAQFQRRLYQHERMKDSPWQHQMFDHFVYLHNQPDNSSRSSANSCSCRCVTWSLGARNLEASRPLCPSNSRNSLYLCGQKKLPFGAASTLRYESMLGHKSPTQGQNVRNESQNSDSSHENDSLEQNSDSRDSTTSRHCTCINYTMWPMPGDVRRGMYGLCPTAGHYVAGDCSHHSPEDIGAMPRNCPPPVTGSNYLDRSEGVVYWSSNDERLI